ncbi:MAG: hypothetical protein IKT22_07735 [Prevotella sp.]|nr:hypothetical protein [Prevotella sp.]MBR6446332.1 hypothetical protein [Prevotella sp.]MBR6495129.1 hypothetical protein [Prevotella sp.]
MNLYLRYFDNEAFVSNADDAIDFLASIPEIGMNADLEADIRNYCASDLMYPKRYKVRPRIYFIVIKTAAESMEDFKQKKALKPTMAADGQPNEAKETQATIISRMAEDRAGWYEGELNFKRVVLVPATGKHEYRDTTFVAQCKAESGIDCYNRIVEHLRQRVDHRSQFPSAKGKNFRYKYLGMWK